MPYAKFGYKWHNDFGEEDENVKRLWQRRRQKQRQTDNGQILIRKAHLTFCSGELKSLMRSSLARVHA